MPVYKTIRELSTGIASGDVSPVELTETFLSRLREEKLVANPIFSH